jgi:hypothetical protein
MSDLLNKLIFRQRSLMKLDLPLPPRFQQSVPDIPVSSKYRLPSAQHSPTTLYHYKRHLSQEIRIFISALANGLSCFTLSVPERVSRRPEGPLKWSGGLVPYPGLVDMRDIFRSNDEDTGGEVDNDILVKEPAIGMLLDMVLFYFVSCFSFAPVARESGQGDDFKAKKIW